MKQYLNLFIEKILIIINCVLVLSCNKSGSCFKREGIIREETRLQNSFFQNIEVENHLNVYIRPHQKQKVIISAGENLTKLIESQIIKNDWLHLNNKNSCLWFGKYKATFRCTVNLENLWEMRLKNYGDIIMLDTLRTPYFSTTSNLSAGTAHFLVNNDHFLWNQHSGAMNLRAEGRCGHLFLYLKDRGHVYCNQLIARTAYVFNEGTGPIYLNVTDTLTLLLDGLGDVYYTGNPHINLLSHLGKGKLIKI